MAEREEAGAAVAMQQWPSWHPVGLSGRQGVLQSHGETGLHDEAPEETVSD